MLSGVLVEWLPPEAQGSESAAIIRKMCALAVVLRLLTSSSTSSSAKALGPGTRAATDPHTPPSGVHHYATIERVC